MVADPAPRPAPKLASAVTGGLTCGTYCTYQRSQNEGDCAARSERETRGWSRPGQGCSSRRQLVLEEASRIRESTRGALSTEVLDADHRRIAPRRRWRCLCSQVGVS